MSDQSVVEAAHLPRVVLSAHFETTFDYPIDKVWPYMIHWNTWITDFVAHRVAGTPDTEGEIRRVSSFDGDGRLALSFLHEVVKFDPPKQFIYKMISPLLQYDADTGAVTEIKVVEYDINNLREESGKTVYTCDVVGEYWSPKIRTEEEARAAAIAYSANGEKNWTEKYFPAAKKLMAEELSA